MIGREAAMQLRDDRAHLVVISDGMRRAALGGVVGPVVFVSAWVVNGLVPAHYSALHDPISDLAGVHASTRVAMTAGFVGFGVAMFFFAAAVRAAALGPAWIAAVVSGAATLGVAAFPLHHSATVDHVHGAFAGTGYVALAAIALLSARRLHALGLRTWAGAATVAGVVSGVALACTLIGSYGGLFQRAGLTAGDVWVVACAVALFRDAWAAFALGVDEPHLAREDERDRSGDDRRRKQT